MRGPYQIRREQTEEGYLFTLIKYKAGKAVMRLSQAEGRSPIAPKWLLEMQAKLNTKAMLDLNEFETNSTQ